MHKDVGKRVMALLLSICMIAGMVDWSGFTVRAADEMLYEIRRVEWDSSNSFTYSGSQQRPIADDIKIYAEELSSGNEVEVQDEANYTLSYGDNINAGSSAGKITVTGKMENGYGGGASCTFPIATKDIGDASVTIANISPDPIMAKEGQEVRPEVEITDNQSGKTLVRDVDFTISWTNNRLGKDDSDLVGVVNITGKNNYASSTTKNFNIKKMDPEKLSIELKESGKTEGLQLANGEYTMLYNPNGQELINGQDVDVKYGDTLLDTDKYKLLYSPKSSGYVGDIKVNVEVTDGIYKGLVSNKEDVIYSVKRNLTKSSNGVTISGPITATMVSDTKLEFDYSSFTFNDPEASADVRAIPNEEKLSISSSGWEDLVQDGNITGDIRHVASVQGKGSKYYVGTITDVPLLITVPILKDSMIHIANNGTEYTERKFDFDGSTEWLSQIINNPQSWVRIGNSEDTYAYGKDYTVSRVPGDTNQTGKNAGSYKFRVTPSGRLRGDAVDVTITVNPMQISNVTIQATEVTYAPDNRTPKPVLTLKYTDGAGKEQTLTEGTGGKGDYEITGYTNQYNAGTGTVNIKGNGNFAGTTTKTYKILPKEMFTGAVVSVEGVTDGQEMPYEWGNPIEVHPIVRVDGYRLNEGTDYDIKYKDSSGDETTHATVDDGTNGLITMQIVGKGNYAGESSAPYSKTFQIVAREWKETELNASYDRSREYTGNPIEPEITFTTKSGNKSVNASDGYTVEYDNNRNVTAVANPAKIKVTGNKNLKGELNYTFNITACNFATLKTLEVTSRPVNGSVDYNLVTGSWQDNYYLYTGQEITLDQHGLSIKNNGTLIDPADYKVSYSDNNGLGEAHITIAGSDNGNYSGSRTLSFGIKGDLSDFNGGFIEKRTNIEIPDQIFNNDIIVPEIPKGKVTFRLGDGAGAQILELEQGKDFTVVNSEKNGSHTTGFTPVGTGEIAVITGMDRFVNSAETTFTVKPLNLTQPGDDLLEKYHYQVEMGDKYTYSDIPIVPKPRITHGSNENNNPLVEGTAYNLEYYDCNNEEEPDGEQITELDDPANFGIGSYKVKIKGKAPNYEGETEKGYTIEPYNLEEGKAKGYIEIEGDADQVVLDHIKYASEYTEEDLNLDPAQKEEDSKAKLGDDGDSIIWKELKVYYTPVDMEGNPTGTRRALKLGDEYTLEYVEGVDETDGKTYSNKKPGEAKYVIKGTGNFTGRLEDTYRLLADLGSERTHITMGDEGWIYTPADKDGIPTNCPIPESVEYKFTIGGEEVTVPIAQDGYAVTYENNGKATKAPKGKEDEETAADLTPEPGKEPTAIVTATEGGITYGRSEAGKFEIYQRDITETVPKADPLPVLYYDGIDENGYEYTGQPIKPDIQLYCKETALKKKGSEGVTDADYEYEVEEKNNIDVYDENGERSDTHAILTAKKNSDGKYDGNYYGNYRVDFKINPRKISDETIDTPQNRIKNSRIAPYGTVATPDKTWIGTYSKAGEDANEWECEFTESPIYFPKEGKELVPPYLLSDGLSISWYGGQDVVPLEEGKDYTIEYKDNIVVGEATVLVKAKEKSNYEGEFPKHFKIMLSIAEAISDKKDRYIELTDYDPNVPFTAQYAVDDVFPKLEFVDKTPSIMGIGAAKVLEEGRDFVIATADNYQSLGVEKPSSNNKEVRDASSENPPTFVVVGIGNYNGNFSLPYNIIPKDIKDPANGVTVVFQGTIPDDEQYTNAYIYDGRPKGEVWIYNNDPNRIGKEGYTLNEARRILRNERDYTLKWDNNIEITTDTSKATVTITAMGPNYTGTRVVEFSIVPQPIKEATATIAPQTFDRQAKTPEVTLNFGGKTLVEGTDYSIAEYGNNTNASVNAQTDEERPFVIVQGMGNFGGTKTIYFDIAQESLTNEEDIEVTGRAIYIEGEPIKPTITVRAKDGTTLVENQDYTVDEYTGPQEVNVPGTVKIHGMGNYKDDRDVTFMIYPPNGDFVIEPIESQEFRNAPIKPEVKVSLRVSEDLSMELIEGQDYVLEWDNIQNAGVNTAKVTAKGLGYFGEKGMQVTQTFTITPKSIGADGAIAAGITASDLGVSQYTGSALTPKVTLTFTPPQPEGKEGEDPSKPVELVQGRDYTVDYVNNVKVGVAKAVIKGIGNYTGSIEKEFEIHANMSMAKIEPIPMQNYTGSAVTPLPVVSLGGQTLALDKDYRVSYSNNVDRGTATITITGIEPWYVGTRTVNFDIARELSEETPIRGVASVYTYTGSPITPPIRVEDGERILVAGVDYEATYSQNVDAGTATVSIKGIGKYTGSTSTTFQIMPQQLGRAKVSPISDQIFNGKEQNPPVTVTSGDKTLQNGKDYSLVYVNSATPGMASAIIKGEGNYTGTQTVNYRIKVPALTGVKFTKSTSSSVTISWTKNSVVTGYEIYNAKNRRALRVKKSSTTKGTVKKLKAGTAATFRVRAYVSKDGQYYYGPFTSVKTATAPSSTKISSLTSKKKKQVVVKWKKVKGATQYEVYRATSKKGKYKKIGTSKKTTYTDKKATGGKRYYYKVRVCKKINKKNYYSSYSAVKSVKAKK